LFVSIGSVIIDDIVLADGTKHMGLLGGGAVHAVMGMRIWSDQVGLVADIGRDFPPDLLQQLEEKFDLQGVNHRDLKTTRAWQIFDEDDTRNEVFRTDMAEFWQMVARVENFPRAYRNLYGIHLHSMGEDVAAWVSFLRTRGNPVILWEPWHIYCVPENHEYLRQTLPLVDIFAPNLQEAQQLLGLQEPQDLLDKFIQYGAKMAAIRMGARGSVFADESGVRIQVPAVPIENVIDVTGAGNAYCGGLVVGLAQTADPLKAVCFAAVSASFALEQFGALYSLEDIHRRTERRYEYCLAAMPNPRRSAFDSLAAEWDQKISPASLAGKSSRIVAACCPKPGERILDVGTGTGSLLPAILEWQVQHIIAVDLSLEMLKCQRLKFGDQDGVLPISADAMHLPMAGHVVAGVICHGVFSHFMDARMTLLELERVLVPGGRLVISHAIGREQVNAIHSNHPSAILRHDLLPPADEVAGLLQRLGWQILESVDEEDFYLIVAQKPAGLKQ